MTPAVTSRRATKADRVLLQAFTCTAVDAAPFEREVQSYLRQHAVPETNRYRDSHDQRYLLLFDGDHLAGAAVHARWPEGEALVGQAGVRLLLAFAVDVSRQGACLSSGQRASEAVLAMVLEDLATCDAAARLLVGRVHQDNYRSAGVLLRAGFVQGSRTDVPDYRLFARVLEPGGGG